jgi:hypothetical protein
MRRRAAAVKMKAGEVRSWRGVGAMMSSTLHWIEYDCGVQGNGMVLVTKRRSSGWSGSAGIRHLAEVYEDNALSWDIAF